MNVLSTTRCICTLLNRGNTNEIKLISSQDFRKMMKALACFCDSALRKSFYYTMHYILFKIGDIYVRAYTHDYMTVQISEKH